MTTDSIATVSIVQQQDLTLLKVYTLYRTILSCAILLAFYIKPTSPLIGGLNPQLFVYSTSAYLAVNLAVLLLVLPKKKPVDSRQLFANFIFDILAIVLIVDATGGINSGLSILLVVSVAASSIMLHKQAATLIAAIASLAMIFDTARLVTLGYLSSTHFLPSGLLGIILFVTSFFIQSLAQRIRKVQLIAEQSAADLNTLQQLNQLIVQRMRTGILITDCTGIVQMCNEAATELLGTRDNKINTHNTHPMILPKSLHDQLNQWLNAPQYHSPPFRATQTGPELQASFSQLTEHTQDDVLIFLEDNRHLAQRAQQMKLASLGRLTASIAHEIRNPLSAINHAAQLLDESKTIDSSDHRLCEIIQNHSDRMNKIIENVLQLSHRHAPNPERIYLHSWISQFITEFESEDYKEPEIYLVPTSQHYEVTVDVSQLTQVLTNLIENGLRHSFQNTGKATLTINFHINRSTHLPVLDIIDDGKGVSDQDQDNIFEPFYTTESAGTGLGLYISRELCESNQSRLDYIQTQDNKSCFRISFPHPDRRLAPD